MKIRDRIKEVRRALVGLLTLAIAVGRFFISPRLNLPSAEGTYEALSHLYIGGLIGACAIKPSKLVIAQIAALAAVELICILVQRS